MSDLSDRERARAFLAATGWLADRPADFARAVLDLGTVRHFDAGEVFNFSGDVEAGIWAIAAGQAFGRSGMNGPKAGISNVLLPGDWAGTGPIFGHARIGDCFARVPTTILLVPYRGLRRLLAEQPCWWEHMGELNFRILRGYGMLATDLLTRDSRSRLAAVLLHATGLRKSGAGPGSVAASQEELGELSNLSRHPVGETLRRFAAHGLLTIGYGTVTVLDAPALRAIANEG
jgi:CRP/FNR family transcriptional regulator, cyclic AMP receptor protein